MCILEREGSEIQEEIRIGDGVVGSAEEPGIGIGGSGPVSAGEEPNSWTPP